MPFFDQKSTCIEVDLVSSASIVMIFVYLKDFQSYTLYFLEGDKCNFTNLNNIGSNNYASFKV